MMNNPVHASENLLHKGEWLLPAIAYGDAAGLPVETRSAAYIADVYGKIESLIPSSENPFYIGQYQPGLWSDDTQLSVAVANSLVESNGFVLANQAAHHVTAYDETPNMARKGITVKRGWGGSTIKAMEALKAGVAPEKSGTPDGAGNGVLMKMAPLAYWQAVRNIGDEERYTQYDQLTTMTHDSDPARLTTRVHGDILISLLREGYSHDMFIDRLQNSVDKHETALGQVGVMSVLTPYLADVVIKEAILQHTDGRGFFAPQTLAMAYGAFIARDGDLRAGVYEAVNLGGDTDSTASIVAAMSVLASKETVVFPADYHDIYERATVEATSVRLARVALRY